MNVLMQSQTHINQRNKQKNTKNALYCKNVEISYGYKQQYKHTQTQTHNIHSDTKTKHQYYYCREQESRGKKEN